MPSGVYTRTAEHCANLSRALKGRKLSSEHIKHCQESLRGHSVSKEGREKASKRMLGNKNWLGRKHSLRARQNMRIAQKKRWASIIKTTPEDILIRVSPEYAEWRKQILERDDYTCQICGIRGGKLVADHILPFAYYPEKRLELSNGRTLCVGCHRKTDTYGSKALHYKTK